jgi:hypothetical protein
MKSATEEATVRETWGIESGLGEALGVLRPVVSGKP